MHCDLGGGESSRSTAEREIWRERSAPYDTGMKTQTGEEKKREENEDQRNQSDLREEKNVNSRP